MSEERYWKQVLNEYAVANSLLTGPGAGIPPDQSKYQQLPVAADEQNSFYYKDRLKKFEGWIDRCRLIRKNLFHHNTVSPL